jgi:hypothetical protein
MLTLLAPSQCRSQFPLEKIQEVFLARPVLLKDDVIEASFDEFLDRIEVPIDGRPAGDLFRDRFGRDVFVGRLESFGIG